MEDAAAPPGDTKRTRGRRPKPPPSRASIQCYPTRCRLLERDGASTNAELLDPFGRDTKAGCRYDRLRRHDRCDGGGTRVASLEAAGHRRGHGDPIGGANDELAVPGRWLCR